MVLLLGFWCGYGRCFGLSLFSGLCFAYCEDIKLIKYCDRRQIVLRQEEMGSTSEREYKEKLNKIQEKVNQKVRDIRNDVRKMEKIKVDSLKKAEDMRRSAEKEINKIEGNVMKSKDLAPESKQRLHSEVAILRSEVESIYVKLRGQVAESIVPVAV